MKNLANCTPREFAAQTALMADALEKWVKLTDLINVRRNVPDLPVIPKLNDNATEEQILARERVIKERNIILRTAALENFFQIMRSALRDHPEETLEVVAYACFIPFDKIDDYKMKDLLRCITEMIKDEDVLDFFTSLSDLGRRTGT